MEAMKTAVKNSRVRNILLLAYVLIVLGISASARANQTIMPVYGQQNGSAQELKTVVGEVAVGTDSRVYLIVSDNVFYELRQSNEDLSVFNGERVQVQGYELMYKAGPVYQLSSFDPLIDDDRKELTSSVLIVLKIRGLGQNE